MSVPDVVLDTEVLDMFVPNMASDTSEQIQRWVSLRKPDMALTAKFKVQTKNKKTKNNVCNFTHVTPLCSSEVVGI